MTTEIIITHQGELVKIRPRVSHEIFQRILGRGDREAIHEFSTRSRKNLLERFAIIDREVARNATFITLTYVSNMQDFGAAKEHVHLFYRKLLRLYPEIYGVWKLEQQERGAIHFHLMVWNLPFINREFLSYTWGETINEWDYAQCSDGEMEAMPPFTRVEYCKNRRKAWYYVSKYIGKVEKAAPGEDSGFNIGTNLVTGRFWGWFNRKAIPYAMEVRALVETTWKAYQRFRWDIGYYLPHTRVCHLAHTVKVFWFETIIDPITMLMNGMEGKRVFTGW